jgi:hypothetical protein
MPTLHHTLPDRLLNPPTPADGTPPVFTPAWWAWRGEADRWEHARVRACLLVHRDLVRDEFTPTIFSDPEPTSCLQVVPEYELWRHADRIKQRVTAWCYLEDAIAMLGRESATDAASLLARIATLEAEAKARQAEAEQLLGVVANFVHRN